MQVTTRDSPLLTGGVWVRKVAQRSRVFPELDCHDVLAGYRLVAQRASQVPSLSLGAG